jgi:hypothetical protein
MHPVPAARTADDCEAVHARVVTHCRPIVTGIGVFVCVSSDCVTPDAKPDSGLADRG